MQTVAKTVSQTVYNESKRILEDISTCRELYYLKKRKQETYSCLMCKIFLLIFAHK